MYWDINIFKEKIKKLEKKDCIFIVSDFDDTIFSTKEILEKDVRKGRRWNEWNKYIEEVIWIDNFVRDFYKWKKFPNNIIKNFENKNTIILTAWFEELQLKKIEAVWIKNIPIKVVFEAKEKPFEMVNYIVNNLGFIPKQLHIYEDRPDFFVEAKKEIEDLLETKIKIFLVKMEDNIKDPEIKEL